MRTARIASHSAVKRACWPWRALPPSFADVLPALKRLHARARHNHTALAKGLAAGEVLGDLAGDAFVGLGAIAAEAIAPRVVEPHEPLTKIIAYGRLPVALRRFQCTLSRHVRVADHAHVLVFAALAHLVAAIAPVPTRIVDLIAIAVFVALARLAVVAHRVIAPRVGSAPAIDVIMLVAVLTMAAPLPITAENPSGRIAARSRNELRRVPIALRIRLGGHREHDREPEQQQRHK